VKQVKKKIFTNKAQSDIFAFDMIVNGKSIIHGRENGIWFVQWSNK